MREALKSGELYISRSGALTTRLEAADTWAPSSPDATTWRPPPSVDGTYSIQAEITASDVDAVLAFAARRLRLGTAARAGLRTVLFALSGAK